MANGRIVYQGSDDDIYQECDAQLYGEVLIAGVKVSIARLEDMLKQNNEFLAACESGRFKHGDHYYDTDVMDVESGIVVFQTPEGKAADDANTKAYCATLGITYPKE